MRSIGNSGIIFGFENGRSRMMHLNVPKITLRDMKGPTPDVIRNILVACGDDYEGARNKALVFLMTVLSLRPCEARRLRVEHYIPDQRKLLILGKGGVEDWMELPTEAARLLDNWLHADKPTEAIFHTAGRSGALTDTGLSDIFTRKISKKTGIKVLPRNLRHSGITIAIREGFKWRSIKAYSRHRGVAGIAPYNDDFPHGEDRTISDLLVKALENGAGRVEATPFEIAERVAMRIMGGKPQEKESK